MLRGLFEEIGVGKPVGGVEEETEAVLMLVYWRRKVSAWVVAASISCESMIMRPCSGASGGTQREGKDGPNMGIRAGAIWEQNVVQTAKAQL